MLSSGCGYMPYKQLIIVFVQNYLPQPRTYFSITDGQLSVLQSTVCITLENLA